MTCTFFGHKDTPSNIGDSLKTVIIDLIENKNADTFFVGNQGKFDSLVVKTLRELHSDYPQIKYSIVLAYVHGKKENFEATNYTETIYPDGLERVPYRFAISHRNRWMADKSEIVVCYIAQTFGGAWSAVEYAKKHGKEIVNLAKK